MVLKYFGNRGLCLPYLARSRFVLTGFTNLESPRTNCCSLYLDVFIMPGVALRLFYFTFKFFFLTLELMLGRVVLGFNLVCCY